jgi:hypothetical protein
VERLYITGGAGSGKTTLARSVSERCALPHFDIDRGETPPVVAGGTWVVEGAHLWGMEAYVDAADVVVWLDLPLRITGPRILRRHVRLTARDKNPHPGVRRLLRFLAAQPRYHRGEVREARGPTDWDALTRSATEAMLARRSDVVHLRRPNDVSRWLDLLHCQRQ